MTSTRQSKTVRTDAVELNDAAFDQAAGGLQYYPLPNPVRLASAGGTDKSITDGTSNIGH